MQLTETQKDMESMGRAGLETLFTKQRETVQYPERRDGMVTGEN